MISTTWVQRANNIHRDLVPNTSPTAWTGRARMDSKNEFKPKRRRVRPKPLQLQGFLTTTKSSLADGLPESLQTEHALTEHDGDLTSSPDPDRNAAVYRPSLQADTRQSEISLGILDYYTHSSSPPQSPQSPPATPFLDEAIIDQFDFALSASIALSASSALPAPSFGDTTSMTRQPLATCPHLSNGIQQAHLPDQTARPVDLASPKSFPQSITIRRTKPPQGYSLFPVVSTPPKSMIRLHQAGTLRRNPENTSLSSLSPESYMRSSPVQPQSHSCPHERESSLTTAPRERKDSGTSWPVYHQRPRVKEIPMMTPTRQRTTSSPAASLSRSTATPSSSTRSSTLDDRHAHRSRWSDGTALTPPSTAATTPGPRTSFGSLLDDRHSDGSFGRYPACFFEYDADDDDEELAPLRRKLPWQKAGPGKNCGLARSAMTLEAKRRVAVDGGGEGMPSGSLGRKLGRALMCGGCFGTV